MEFQDLMAGPPPTHLPVDPAVARLEAGTPAADVVRDHPESPAAWATLSTPVKPSASQQARLRTSVVSRNSTIPAAKYGA